MTEIEMTDLGKRGLSGSTLKIIAIITMFIDHVGATILARMIRGYWQLSETVTWEGLWNCFPWMASADRLLSVYETMRAIGRIAFPIYCFLLVEGFEKTRSRRGYAMRLGIFALISEVPFDLAFNGRIMDLSYQNVFFTLFLGLLTMAACEKIRMHRWGKTPIIDQILRCSFLFLGVAAGALAAELLKCDYGARGVFCILALYLLKRDKGMQMVGGAVSFCWEMPAPLAFLPIACYNGRRGLNLKYVFYAFYPLHLFLLYLLCTWIGIEGLPAL